MDDSMKCVFDTLDNFGWTIRDCGDSWWELSKYTMAGYDFSFTVDKTKSADEFVRDVQGVSYQFDVEKWVYEWLDAKINGGTWAPYVTVLVGVATAIDRMLDDLVNALMEVVK